MTPRPAISLIGPGEAAARELRFAEEAGKLIAEGGAVLVCGGLGGVMEAACRGARRAGGVTVGILPGVSALDANPWVEIAVPTGLGEARNALVVRAAGAVVAIGGGLGTLSEIALALKAGKPVFGVDTWRLEAAWPSGQRSGPVAPRHGRRAAPAEAAAPVACHSVEEAVSAALSAVAPTAGAGEL